MTVVVSFVTPRGVGSLHSPGVGAVRIREDITIPGTTTATVQSGEIVLIGNAESSMVAAAFGTTPDAATTTETTASSAGIAVPAGTLQAVAPPAGAKINIKALA